MGVHLRRNWSQIAETASCLLWILTSPPSSSNTSTPFFVLSHLKRLPHNVSNAGFSFVLASGSPPCVRYVVEIFPGVFETQRGSYSKKAPSTQILMFRTLAHYSSLHCPDTTHNPSKTIPQFPSIALVTGSY